MNSTENERVSEVTSVVLSGANHATIVQLLSRSPSSTLGLVISMVGAGIVTYYMRSVGLSSTGALIVGIFCGGGIGMFIDLMRLRSRMLKALALIVQAEN
jgi:hypothetical protein